jgi:diguanylate cyclase (GGDEF)-like protein/PAS domain S-box-containing protein
MTLHTDKAEIMQSTTSSTKRWSIIFTVGYVAFYYLFIAIWKSNETVIHLGSDLLQLLASLISCIWLLKTCIQAQKQDRIFWFCLFFGVVSFALAGSICLWYEVGLKVELISTSVADIFWLLTSIFYLIAMLGRMNKMKNSFTTVRFFLDILIMMGVVVTLSWKSFISTQLQLSGITQLHFSSFVDVGYTLTNLVLLFFAFMLFLYPGELLPKRILFFILGGFMLLVFADTVYLNLLLSDSYSTGSFLDPIWSFSVLLIGLSGLYSKDNKDGLVKEAAAGPASERFALVRTFSPYISLIPLIVILVFRQDWIDKTFMIITGVLVISRQIVTILENRNLLRNLHDLNNQLEYKVQTRTKELAKSEQRFKSLFEHHPDGVFSVDLNGSFTSFNEGCIRLTGYGREELMDRSFLQLVLEEDREKAMYHFSKAKINEPQHFEISTRNKEGMLVHLNVTNLPMIIDGNLAGVFGVAQDITQEKKNQERINHMAHHDVLTGLPNRRLFEQRVDQAIIEVKNTGKMVAVMFIDLDRFKIINDTLGHDAGDQLLLTVAERLKTSVNSKDTVARQGGDEFTVLINELYSAQEAAAAADNIITALNLPFLLGEHEVLTTPSIGIALYPEHADTAVGLMKNADTAMYRVKENGKNHYLFYTCEMAESSAKKLILEKELHKALSNQEFEIYYQPQVDIQWQKITGVEALLRWHHPTLGLLPASDFIPMAEETGLILPIGEWVLRQACKQAKAWQDEGIPLMNIGVNLSSKQFYQENLVDVVAQVLEETQLLPCCLNLEITESIAMSKADEAVEKLHQIKSLGVQISMDDFGTGYSSLSYLTKFPIDILKIPREFVSDIGKNLNNEAIIASIVDMTKNLQLHVIAEGVETEQQSMFLQSQACNEMQGFLFSEPLPAKELIEMFKNKEAI